MRRLLTATVTYFIFGIGIRNFETYDIVMCGVKSIELKNKRSEIKLEPRLSFRNVQVQIPHKRKRIE